MQTLLERMRKTQAEFVFAEVPLLFEAHQDDFVLQLEDFIENVQSGRTESERLPHALTLDIIGILETCRKQSGVIYPCDEEE